MAYLRSIIRLRCQHPGCGSFATVRVVDRWNGERGAYCDKHAKPALDRQNKSEAVGFRSNPTGR